MIELLTGVAYDCLGCMEDIPPSGFDQLFVGLVVALVAMAPVAVLHRLLRRRGR